MTDKVVKATVGNIRQLETDEEEDHEESWKSRPEFVPLVALLRRQMRLELQRLVDSQDCFGWLWFEEDGSPCPEAKDCDLASYCQQAWQMAQVEKGSRTREVPKKPKPPVAKKPKPPPPSSDFVEGDPRKRSRKRAEQANARVQRHKWAGTAKYRRKGYQDLGRPVDRCVAAFMEGLDASVLPAGWNKAQVKDKLSAEHELTVSVTASYHSVMYAGVVMVRFWTNSASRAIVDIVPELLKPVKDYLHALSWPADQKAPMLPPVPCPANSWMKVRPCTHRVVVSGESAARGLGALVRAKFV